MTSSVSWYIEPDGTIHWPDTFVGSNLDYTIDWSTYLTNENDTFVSMTWVTIPTGLSSTYNVDVNNTSILQLSADTVGDYQIDGVMVHSESGHEQVLAIRMFLKVT